MVATSTSATVIRDLGSLGLADVPIAGGHGANLGDLRSAGVPGSRRLRDRYAAERRVLLDAARRRT